MAFGDIAFNVTSIRVARMLANGTYLTTSYEIQLGQEMSFKAAHDTDQIKAYGMITNRLSILTSLEGMMRQASMDDNALFVMTGTGTSTSGVTPAQVATATFLGGGSGMPYFGLVAAVAAEDGANALVGVYKCQLNEVPAWKVEQNKFMIAELPFFAMALNTSGRKMFTRKKYETAVSVPVDINGILV